MNAAPPPGATVLVAHAGAQLYGSDRMVLETVRGLVAAGWRVVVTVPDDGPLLDEVRACGATVARCPTPVLRKAYLNPAGVARLGWRALASLPAGVRLLRAHRPAVVYVNTVTIPLWLVLARALRTPSVAHVHEAESTLSSLVRRALTVPLLLATRVVVNSRFCGDVTAADWSPLRARIELVYNGVEGPEAPPPPPRPELTSPVRLVFIGRISERKGVQEAVDALAVLRDKGIDARLDIVGDAFTGNEWLQEDLVERSRAAGTADAVRFHGFDRIWPHLARADILVAPFRLDSFGLVVVEGALAARPIVYACAGGMAEAAAASRAAMAVEPQDPTAIAEAVASIVTRWPEYRAWAVEDVPAVTDRFSPVRYRAGIGAAVARAASARRTRQPKAP